MNDKFFLDTNIIVYSFDTANPEKRQNAQKLIAHALSNHQGCISSQVIQEFFNVAIRKFATPLSITDCQIYLTTVLEPLCETFASIELYHQALEILNRWQFSFYDALIIAAALHANCSMLYTEDLQHGQIIQNLKVINPFLP